MKAGMAVLLALGVVISVQGRVWTNSDGKTLEAELVRVKGDQVFLKVEKNRKIYPFDIAALSADDQAFIKAYEQRLAEQRKEEALNNRRNKWHTDFAEAEAEAKEWGFPILFLYTAPEWCGYCQILEKNVLDTSEFRDYSRRNLVLYIADFSEPADGERWKKDNADLYKKFPCGGFPCTYLLSTDGKQLGKIGGADSEWDAAYFINRLEGYKNAPPKAAGKKNRKKKKS